jgi:hypothetical protein
MAFTGGEWSPPSPATAMRLRVNYLPDDNDVDCVLEMFVNGASVLTFDAGGTATPGTPVLKTTPMGLMTLQPTDVISWIVGGGGCSNVSWSLEYQRG